MTTTTVKFKEEVIVVDVKGSCKEGRIHGENTIKRCLTPRRKLKRRASLSYTTEQAHAVAKRMEKEIRNNQLLSERVKAEIHADQLLVRQKLFKYVARVYRLSNQALVLLQKRLLINERNFKNKSVPRFLPY